ncbi:hypothetical protein ACSDR0_48325 [Streptosporangium sp. G11]|uniref:hypothetical protein n=1 Tax=Streptosporangium sp. G11 TaxID=3436926 RepID=UPI003EC04047
MVFHLYAPALDAAQSITGDTGGTGHGLRPEAGNLSLKYLDSRPVTYEANAVISLTLAWEADNLFGVRISAGSNSQREHRALLGRLSLTFR